MRVRALRRDRAFKKEPELFLCERTFNDCLERIALHGRSFLSCLLIGAVAGGNSLPQLRSAMHAADQVMGASSPHAHPRIEAAAVAPLLTASGFVKPVVDVDRVQVSYASLDRLVSDLRGMAATNILNARSRRPLSRMAREAATAVFEDAGEGGRTTETFEIIHFAAWTASAGEIREQG